MLINTKQQNNKGTKLGEKFKCYSPVLHRRLQKEGFMCLYDGFNNQTKKPYWVYKMTNALSRELIVWTNNKQSISS